MLILFLGVLLAATTAGGEAKEVLELRVERNRLGLPIVTICGTH
jgi:hypothetical protein